MDDDRQPVSVFKTVAATILQVTGDIGALKFNTAIAALMNYLNGLETQSTVSQEELLTLVLLLARSRRIAPKICGSVSAATAPSTNSAG